MKLPTTAVRTGIATDTQHGAVVPPLHLSTNFTFDGYDTPRRYDYTRSGNPTRDILAETLASLEDGAGGVVTSSGMSAIALVGDLLPTGSRIVATHDCYGGTWRLLDAWRRQGRFRVEFVNLTDAAALDAALSRYPALVWIETPSNPLLRLTDLETLAHRAHERKALVAVDNTFCSPVLQQPLRLGADLVVHSTTKYIAGHSDVVGGAVIARTEELHERVSWWANCVGYAGAPFDSYLTLRGARTLDARMRVHQENAKQVVHVLLDSPAVERVHWPGLSEHPQHELAKRQQSGYGAIVSFELAPRENAVPQFLEKIRLFSLAESLGGVESLIAHPATMTHRAMSPAARRDAGIADTLIRLSVGIEAAEDLCDDLTVALS